MKRMVALIGYPAEYFLPFARAMQKYGFEVFWVCALKADVNYLARNGELASRILDLNHDFHPGAHPLSDCREVLSRFENDVDPKVNDIILMDRLMREKDWKFSIEYLHHVATSVADFLSANGINLVSSWRDTSIQLISMLVTRRLGIPFVVPTRIRIPQEIYGFCSAHHTDSFICLRETTAADVAWSETFLETFESRKMRPALKISTRNFIDIFRLVPSHTRAFLYELRRSISDIGNDYTRYPIGRLLLMYLRRRTNLTLYKLFNPSEHELPQGEKFCIYALHTQPESSIDVQGSYFSNQLELIRYIARSLPATHVLYVKVHPTDVDGKSLSFYRQIKQIPSVKLVDYSVDSRVLLDRASIVFALTGTIAYEAGLLQKAVVVFARNYFNGLPTVHFCESPFALPTLVSKLLSGRDLQKNYRAEILSFLSKLRASCFQGEVSRSWVALNKGLTADDLHQLQIAYSTVYRVVTNELRE